MKNLRTHTATANAWFNQQHPAGRASNLFFEGTRIYSYGYHYQIAEIVTAPNGDTFYFVNTNGYSNSTAKHTRHVRYFTPYGYPTLNVPFPQNRFSLDKLPLIIERLKIDAANAYRTQLKARDYTHYFFRGDNIRAQIATISNTFTLTRPFTDEEYTALEELRQKALNKVEQIEAKRQAIIESHK